MDAEAGEAAAAVVEGDGPPDSGPAPTERAVVGREVMVAAWLKLLQMLGVTPNTSCDSALSLTRVVVSLKRAASTATAKKSKLVQTLGSRRLVDGGKKRKRMTADELMFDLRACLRDDEGRDALENDGVLEFGERVLACALHGSVKNLRRQILLRCVLPPTHLGGCFLNRTQKFRSEVSEPPLVQAKGSRVRAVMAMSGTDGQTLTHLLADSDEVTPKTAKVVADFLNCIVGLDRDPPLSGICMHVADPKVAEAEDGFHCRLCNKKVHPEAVRDDNGKVKVRCYGPLQSGQSVNWAHVADHVGEHVEDEASGEEDEQDDLLALDERQLEDESPEQNDDSRSRADTTRESKRRRLDDLVDGLSIPELDAMDSLLRNRSTYLLVAQGMADTLTDVEAEARNESLRAAPATTQAALDIIGLRNVSFDACHNAILLQAAYRYTAFDRRDQT